MNRPSNIVMACPAKRPWAGVNDGEILMLFFFLFPLGKKMEDRIQKAVFQEEQGHPEE